MIPPLESAEAALSNHGSRARARVRCDFVVAQVFGVMPDRFQCPKCGVAYVRERRRVGKAVICACGHKFLVPPADLEAPLPAVPSPTRPALRAPPQAGLSSRTRPTQPPAAKIRSGDSSSVEILPLAESVEPAAFSGGARWAEPIGPEPSEALPQAEVVCAGNPYPDALAPGDDLFSPGGAYDHPAANGPLIKPLPSRSARPTSPVRKVRRERPTKRSPRPLGIVLLALLHFLFGAVFATAIFVGVHGLADRHAAAGVLAVGLFVPSLFIAFGVGMLYGMKWVWWLEAFAMTCSICGSAVSVVLALAASLLLGFHIPLLGALSALFVLKYLTRLVFGSLLLAYLFKENVLAFFGLKRLDTGQALGILFGIAITLTLVATGIGLVVLRARFAPATTPQAAHCPQGRQLDTRLRQRYVSS